jgi:XTP/dITP diphosphohydrolase
MQRSYKVFFVSSNRDKYREAKKILSKFGIKLGFFYCKLEEVQADSIKEIAIKKVQDAYDKCKKPVIVEDDGIFIDSLNGFPGPYSSYVYKTIGNSGILRLIGAKRSATFESVIAFCDKNGIMSFTSKIPGTISKNPQGKGWGYDPIFIPKGKTQTYAMLSDKNNISHRFQALKKFSNWFLHMQQSNGP